MLRRALGDKRLGRSPIRSLREARNVGNRGRCPGRNQKPIGADTFLAWGYLVVFGSMVAFSAYVWLLGNAPISLVATYAYVNPVVAVLLGALILDEPITHAVLIGGAIIVAAVAIVISVERVRSPASATDPEADPQPV